MLKANICHWQHLDKLSTKTLGTPRCRNPSNFSAGFSNLTRQHTHSYLPVVLVPDVIAQVVALPKQDLHG